MVKIFLDANAVIDLVERRKEYSSEHFASHVLYISPLSLQVLAYVYKYRCPSEVLQAATEAFSLVSLDVGVTVRSSHGPTPDYEDNIQLQSASSADCDFFVTSDQELLKLGIFGKTTIVAQIPT